jgi:hypothetical protein
MTLLSILLPLLFSPAGQTRSDFNDSLPPLHTLRDKDIVIVNTSWEDRTIMVALKDGVTYVYPEMEWDFEDYNPATPARISEA